MHVQLFGGFSFISNLRAAVDQHGWTWVAQFLAVSLPLAIIAIKYWHAALHLLHKLFVRLCGDHEWRIQEQQLSIEALKRKSVEQELSLQSTHQSAINELTRELESLKEDAVKLGRYKKKFHLLGKRYRRFVDGRIWCQEVQPDELSSFRLLTQGRPPIIAIANLKGGVGKTTISTNLAATWARGGDVLLVDLDYQGSATQTLLSNAQMEEVASRAASSGAQGLLSHCDQVLKAVHTTKPLSFAQGRTQTASCPVLQYRQRIGTSGIYLIPAFDPLDRIENELMIAWAFGEASDDVRFRLRNLLHSDTVQSRYQHIVLDCPPRCTTASINAFACADFLLIPVIPNPLSARSVERFLSFIEKFRRTVNPRLQVLGIVANRVQTSRGLSPSETQVWAGLSRTLKRDGERCHQFETYIPNVVSLARIGEMPNDSVPDGVTPHFADLALEIDNQIQTIKASSL